MMPFSLNIKGRLLTYNRPAVMGILNVTPDSFYAGSHTFNAAAIEDRAKQIISEGADIIDLGGYSSRPGADDVSVEEEIRRIRMGMQIIRKISPDIPVSVDTFRADIASEAIEKWDADIINDISGGSLDNEMFDAVAELNVPYILMHMRGTPRTMQSHTGYTDVTAEVIAELSRPLHELTLRGVSDIIIDPGFGFAKSLEQNYELMAGLRRLCDMGYPVLSGVSRKSMIYRLLDITPQEALAGTAALHWESLRQGATILRVHDTREAADVVRMFEVYRSHLRGE